MIKPNKNVRYRACVAKRTGTFCIGSFWIHRAVSCKHPGADGAERAISPLR